MPVVACPSACYNPTMKLMRELRCVSALPECEDAGTNSWAGSVRADCLAPLWTLRIVVEGPVDPITGYVCDVHALDVLLRDRVVPVLQARVGELSSPGAVAPALRDGFGAAAPHCPDEISLCSIVLLVSPFTSFSVHRDDTTMVRLTRCYEFAAAHRLYGPDLSDEENRRLFGKCSNPHGHGHNYIVEVTVGGTIDAHTGTIVDLPAFDRTVDALVITPFDHKNLNVECAEFAELNPSVENIARVIFGRLDGAVEGPELINVRVWETPKTYADFGRDD